MVRTQIQLTEEQFNVLKKMAAERQTSIAEIVRLSITSYMKSTARIDNEERKKRAIAAAGRFRSGLSDLSVKHDHYLAEALADR